MKKTPPKPEKAPKPSSSRNARIASVTGVGTTSSGPSHAAIPRTELAGRAQQQESLALAMPENKTKPHEYGYENAVAPSEGAHTKLPSPAAGAGTLSEKNASSKTGKPATEPVAAAGSLEHARVNSAGQVLTTNQGVSISDNQNSLKAGLRGPTLLEDFVLREKITHFDHERIPERIVHARGSGAHGYFECYKPLTKYTKAAPFAEKGKITPCLCASRPSPANAARRTPLGMCAASQ